MKKNILKILLILLSMSVVSAYANNLDSYKKSCDNGDGSKCVEVAMKYYDVKDYSFAVMYLLQGCANSDGNSCHLLGLMQMNGQGIPQNDTEAMESFVQACDYHSGAGCYAVGNSLLRGIGVKKDYIKSLGYFEVACDYGDARGCHQAGVIRKLNKHYTQAAQLFRKACDGGDRDGCNEYRKMNR